MAKLSDAQQGVLDLTKAKGEVRGVAVVPAAELRSADDNTVSLSSARSLVKKGLLVETGDKVFKLSDTTAHALVEVALEEGRVEATLHTSAADREPGGEVSERRIERVVERTAKDPIWQEPAEDTVSLIRHEDDGSETVLWEEPLDKVAEADAYDAASDRLLSQFDRQVQEAREARAAGDVEAADRFLAAASETARQRRDLPLVVDEAAEPRRWTPRSPLATVEVSHRPGFEQAVAKRRGKNRAAKASRKANRGKR